MGSTLDHRGSTLDHKGSTLDHRGSTLDHRGSTFDHRSIHRDGTLEVCNAHWRATPRRTK